MRGSESSAHFERAVSLSVSCLTVAKIDPEQESLAFLVREAQAGSEAALELLVSRFRDRIAGFIYSLVGNDDAIEDICHNVFLKIISGLSRLKAPDSFEAWLFRIARNACTDFVSKKHWWRMFVPFEQKHEPMVSDLPGTDDRIDAFRAALEELPRAQKELILLLADNEWSYEQLAAITGSTVSAVKSRLFRAREFLRNRITDEN